MPKRRIRITPKIRKKARKDTNSSRQSSSASSGSVDESKEEFSGSSKVVGAQSHLRKAGSLSSKTKNATTKAENSKRIRDLTVSKSAFAKWKPLNSSTKNYILQILADKQLNIISEASNDPKKGQVQHCLNNLLERIIDKLECLRGPDNKLNYEKLESECKSIEEMFSNINSQLLPLQTELEQEKSLLQTEEKQLHEYENNTANQDQNIQGIPSKSLNLTKLSKESLERPIPKIPSDLNKSAERLKNVLATKMEQLEEVGFTKWIEALYQLQSQINTF